MTTNYDHFLGDKRRQRRGKLVAKCADVGLAVLSDCHSAALLYQPLAGQAANRVGRGLRRAACLRLRLVAAAVGTQARTAPRRSRES